jgi:hypothetical protein
VNFSMTESAPTGRVPVPQPRPGWTRILARECRHGPPAAQAAGSCGWKGERAMTSETLPPTPGAPEHQAFRRA